MAQTVGFSRALATVRRTVAARRDAKRRARTVRIPPCNPCIVCRKNKKQRPTRCCLWRRRWDSNPRGIAAKLISSQSRYDRFDTSAYLVLLHATWAIWFAPYYILHIAHYSIPNLSPFVNQNSRCFCVGVGSKGESSWWRRMKTWRVFSVMDRPLCLGTV